MFIFVFRLIFVSYFIAWLVMLTLQGLVIVVNCKTVARSIQIEAFSWSFSTESRFGEVTHRTRIV